MKKRGTAVPQRPHAFSWLMESMNSAAAVAATAAAVSTAVPPAAAAQQDDDQNDPQAAIAAETITTAIVAPHHRKYLLFQDGNPTSAAVYPAVRPGLAPYYASSLFWCEWRKIYFFRTILLN